MPVNTRVVSAASEYQRMVPDPIADKLTIPGPQRLSGVVTGGLMTAGLVSVTLVVAGQVLAADTVTV